MCGIAGCHFGRAGGGEDERARVRAMAKALTHRGPDAFGEHESASWVLAHTRLAIRDLSPSGAQPMRHPSGAVIAYNGELYGIAGLRARLESAGERMRGTSDTEVLLRACAHLGVDDAARAVNGMYAFALALESTGAVDLVRDRLGIKPLYYAKDGDGRTWFASEIRALAAHAPIDRALDEAALAWYALLGFVPGPRTVFRAIRAVPPGHRVRLGEDGPEAPVRHAPEEPAREPLAYDDAIASIREALQAAVLRQLEADVPLGAFLSGGVDSSTIAALVRGAGRDLATFTIGYEGEPTIDESPFAERVARHLGTHHTLLVARPDDVREAIVHCVSHQGQPFADPSLVPTYLVSRLARAHVTVALSGDGADELFAGYAKYRTELVRARVRRAPRPALVALAKAARAVPASRFTAAGEHVRKLRKLTAALVQDGPARWSALQAILPDRRAAEALVVPALRAEARAPEGVVAALTTHGDGLAGMLAADRAVTLPDRMLYKVDQASMAASLEVRVPFLDDEVVDRALRLPMEALVGRGAGKRVLRDIARPLLPAEVETRPKRGFDFPAGRWLAGPLATMFWDHVRSERARSLLDVKAVETLFARHERGHEPGDHALWTVFALAVWIEGVYRFPS